MIAGKEVKKNDSEEDGTRHFMVNVIEPQFNLHSEEANVSFIEIPFIFISVEE